MMYKIVRREWIAMVRKCFYSLLDYYIHPFARKDTVKILTGISVGPLPGMLPGALRKRYGPLGTLYGWLFLSLPCLILGCALDLFLPFSSVPRRIVGVFFCFFFFCSRADYPYRSGIKGAWILFTAFLGGYWGLCTVFLILYEMLFREDTLKS